ncbi:MAG: hypothetical protein QM820_09035 [Minicystis sp.]
MANWMTVSEISARYIVGEQKLLAYARRGNMPMMRCEDGSILFDGSYAAQLFRPRSPEAAITAPATGKPNMGVLGVSRLGEKAAPQQTIAAQTTPLPTTPEPSVRRSHRRELRFSSWEESVEDRARKAAG